MTRTVLVLMSSSKEHLNELSPDVNKEYLDFLVFLAFLILGIGHGYKITFFFVQLRFARYVIIIHHIALNVLDFNIFES
jgi:hypothetical protein